MKRIVILGAGFGGLRAAVQIAKKLRGLNLLHKYQVILIDKNDYHLYTPLLYEVATTSKQTADFCKLHEVATHKIRQLIKGLPVAFIHAEVDACDVVDGHIHLKDGRTLVADCLIIALGAETNYYDIPGLKEHALTLKTFADAVRIRDAVWNLAMDEKDCIEVVVGGGGSTGVELAAELKTWCGELERDFPKCRLNVTIIQGAPSILNELEPKVVSAVKNRLKKLGVKLLEGQRVASLKKSQVALASGKSVSYDVFIWTGGVKAPRALARLPLKEEERGRLEVVEDMECIPSRPELKLRPRLYALGDAVCFYDPATKKPIPGVARAAIDQADVVAHNLIEEIKKSENETYNLKAKSYKAKSYPYIIPVGGKYAVAKFGSLVISGFFGWILKGLVELNYLFSIMPLWRALTVWLKGLKIFIQNDRLG